MTIGTSLFHTLNTRSLSRLNDQIATLQEQISSGKNDPSPSADPVRALRLSAAQDQQQALDRFSANLERAQARLDQADGVMDEATNIVRRVGELAVRAASDSATLAERDTIGVEVRELRRGLLDLANARDDTGRPLFGGYQAQGNPFQDQGVGQGVAYLGDGGQPRLQVSETGSLPTGLSGAQVFRGVPGDQGGDIFAMIDDFLATLGAEGPQWRDSATAAGQMGLDLTLTRAPAAWSLSLAGPEGSAEISFDAAAGALGGAVEAINAQTAVTGVSAALDPETGALQLMTAQGEVTVSAVSVTPETRGTLALATGADGQTSKLVAPGLTADAQISRLRAAADHLADQRAELGALSGSAVTQSDIIANRKLIVDKAVAGLQDLDLAAALTRLQQAMLDRDATQQAYVKITQKNLFDYLR